MRAELAVIGPPAVIVTSVAPIPVTSTIRVAAVVTTVIAAIRPFIMVASIWGETTILTTANSIGTRVFTRGPRLEVATLGIRALGTDPSPGAWLVSASGSLSCGPTALRGAVSLKGLGIAFFVAQWGLPS